MRIHESRLLVIFLSFFVLTACGGDSGDSEAQGARISINSIEDTQRSAGDGSEATFQDLSGQPLELADFRGRKVVLNYWATWCAPCIEELPALARAAEALGSENFIFLLASDESIGTISAFIDERDLNGNFIKLNTFFASHGVPAVPSTFLYDEQGTELANWLGAYEWDSPEMLEQLRNPELAEASGAGGL